MNIKEISLKRALTTKQLSELPKQFREDSGEYWLESIILTRKRDGTQSYAVGKRKADGKIAYIADFGSMSPIAALLSVHPYLYLNKKRYMPYETIKQKRHALAQYIGGDEDAKKAVDELSDCEVEYQILEFAIEAQYGNKEIAATHDKIMDAIKGALANFQEKHNGDDVNSADAKETSEAIITEVSEPEQMSMKRMSAVIRKRKNN